MKDMISIIKNEAIKKGFIKRKTKFNIFLPKGFSNILYFGYDASKIRNLQYVYSCIF